jgi:Mg-chelatase subunit ChlD
VVALLLARSGLGSSTTVLKPRLAVVILVDSSSSMQGAKHNQATAAASLFVAACDAEIDLEVIAFDSRVRPLTGRIAPAALGRRQSLLTPLATLAADGSTDLLGGLTAAFDTLVRSDAATKALICLTDGQQTIPLQGRPATDRPQREDILTAGRGLARRAQNEHVRIFAVGLGEDVDRDLLESLAVATQGVFRAIANPGELLPVYVEFLRSVGGYDVARDTDQVRLGTADRDLKILAALPSTRLDALERNGQPIRLSDGAIQAWSDPVHHLQVVQCPMPQPGLYRLRLAAPRSPADAVFFLRRSPRRWTVDLDYHPDGLLEPLRIVASPEPALPGDAPIDLEIAVEDPHGRVLGSERKLNPRPDGRFAGELFLDPDVKMQKPGVYTARVRIRDPQSGWESDQARSIRFEAGPPQVVVELQAPPGIRIAERGRETDLDLGLQPPGAERELTLRIRSTPSARGRSLSVTSWGEGSGLVVAPPKDIALTEAVQSVRIPVRTPTPFLTPRKTGLVLSLPAEPTDTRPATINGSPDPLTLHIAAQPSPQDLHVDVVPPPGELTIACGRQAVLGWTLRLDGPVPKARVEAVLHWGPPPGSAPQLALDGAGPGSNRLEILLAPVVPLRIAVTVPGDAAPGSFRAELVLHVLGEVPTTINGQETLELPLTFRTEPRSARLELLDATGVLVRDQTLRLKALSPVAERREILRLALRGEPIPGLKVRMGGDSTIDGVQARVQHTSTPDPDADGWGTLEVDLTIPAQCAPGMRRFRVDLEAGPSVRLAPECRSLFVVLEVPRPVLRITPAPGAAEVLTYRWGWWGWLLSQRWGRPRWYARHPFRVATTDLEAAFHLGPARLPGDEGRMALAARPGGLWDADLTLPVPERGRYPITATLDCDYHHLRVEIPGAVIAADRPGRWSPRVGTVEIRGPSPWAPLGMAVAACGLFALDRLRRRRVPGQLLQEGTDGSALDEDQRRIRLGRRAHRVTLDGQVFRLVRRWGTVWIRWIGRAPDGEAGLDVTLECPAGHTRRVRLRGSWERLAHDDRLRVGRRQFRYLAPIARHCPSTSRVGPTEFGVPTAAGWPSDGSL